MFGEAFAAELGAELAHSAASSVSGINMTTLNPQWTVGEEQHHGEIEETDDNIIFSKYVFGAVKRSFLFLDVFRRDNRELSEEEAESSNFWVKYQKASTNSSKLKKFVRRHVPPTVRARMWQESSGGSSFMSRLPNIYQETCLKLFGKDNKLPGDGTTCTLANDSHFMSYYLTSEGVICLRRILFVLSHFHPDITFCPILQEVAAIFLHFMEEVWCFACMSAMLTGKKMYFDQTHAQAEASDMAFHICAMTTMKKETKRLQHFVLESSGKTEVNLFPNWLRMMFQYLDFTVLMRLVDCFVVEGPKIFFRTGLFLVRLFYEYSLDFERIGFPTSKDFVVALGQYSEALKIHADGFVKAALRIKIKNRQINAAIEKSLSGEKHQQTENEETRVSRMISFDVTSISDIIKPKQWECLIGWLPARIQLLKPEIAFTTDIDGFSLKTLYNKTEEEDQTLIILKTDKDEIFGGYLSMPLSDRKNGKRDLTYFGTGESFLFSVEPMMERFLWTEIDQVDGKPRSVVKRKSSFVIVDIKSTSHRKRRSFRISKRKVSVKLQGIPKNFSFADIPSNKSYGGIRKNSSVVHLTQYAHIDDNGTCSEQGSPVLHLHNASAISKDSPHSVSNLPSVFSGSSPKPSGTETGAVNYTPNSATSQHDSRVRYKHSLSENQAGEYSSVGEEDADDMHRITRLPDELCLVEKRIELDHEDGKPHPEHAHHVKHAPNDLFVAGNDRCLIIGGGGGNGIWIDESLYRGRSEVCNTFHNRILTKSAAGDFNCVRLEMFRFRDADI